MKLGYKLNINIFQTDETYIKNLVYDHKEYYEIAKSIIENKTFSFNETLTTCRAPLYPFFLSFILYFFNNSWIIFFQKIVLYFNTIIVYLLGKELKDRNVGILSSIIFIFYFPIHIHAFLLLSETLFIFLLTLFFYFFIKSINKSFDLKYLIMSSIFLSFATLTRPSTLLLPFLILPFTFFYKKNELKKSFLFLLTFLFLLMPWTIRNYQVTNRFISIASLGAFNLWDGTYYSCVLYNTGMALSVDKEMFSEHERIRSNYYYIDYQAEPEFMKQALIRIKDKPFTYIRFCIERIIRVYSAFPGTRDLMISKPILYWPLSIFQILFNTFGLIGILKLDKTIKFTIIGMLLYSIFFNSLFNLLSRYTLPWSILIIIGLSIFLVDNTNIIYKKFKGK